MSIPKPAYICDPAKNTTCTKEGCVIFHVCRCTSLKEFAKTGENGKPIVALGSDMEVKEEDLRVKLFKNKSEAKSLQEQYDKLKEAYKKLEDKYNSTINDKYRKQDCYNQAMETVKKQREFILELQDKISVLQEELIAKNKIIQGMDNANQ